MKKIPLFILFGFAFLVALVAGIWAYGIPDSYVEERIIGSAPSPLTVRIEGFRKTLLLGFAADALTLGARGSDMIRITGISGGLAPLTLLKGRVEIRFRGLSCGGSVAGTMSLHRGGAEGAILIDDIHLSEVEGLAGAGIQLKGSLSADAKFRGGSGSAQFTVQDLSAGVMNLAGIPVPLQYFHSVRGAIEMPGKGAVSIKSVSLEGQGIYLRAKGNVTRGVGDITIEIMPEESFADKTALMLLERYKVSEGYYRVPLRISLRNMFGGSPGALPADGIRAQGLQGPQRCSPLLAAS
ncbi:MAG: type II secretion system protein GspN [Thermodesulfovibrionales bacterium]